MSHRSQRASNEAIEEFVASDMSLTPKQVSAPYGELSGIKRTELGSRIAWARTRLRREGKIINRSKGVWALAAK